MTPAEIDAIEKAKRKLCPWCESGDPMTLDNDGVERHGMYHSFYGGNRECQAPMLQKILPSKAAPPIRSL